nr:protein PLANT CADMIUM RESISTANCE 2-like [Ipomoea batatas]
MYCLIAGFIGCPCLYSCSYRSKLRKDYMLPESPCGDCLVHCCCESCALCQEYRELKHRGFNMSLGWEGNMERQNMGVGMTAPGVQGGMNR